MGLNIKVIFFRHTVLGQGRKAVGPPGGWRATLWKCRLGNAIIIIIIIIYVFNWPPVERCIFSFFHNPSLLDPSKILIIALRLCDFAFLRPAALSKW